MAPCHCRRESDEKVVASGQNVQNRGALRQGIGNIGNIREKFADGSRSICFPGKRIVRTIGPDQRSIRHEADSVHLVRCFSMARASALREENIALISGSLDLIW